MISYKICDRREHMEYTKINVKGAIYFSPTLCKELETQLSKCMSEYLPFEFQAGGVPFLDTTLVAVNPQSVVSLEEKKIVGYHHAEYSIEKFFIRA